MVKVLIIGLDGATWDIIMPAIKNNKLPTFKKLIKHGVHGSLFSTIPPYTVPAWNTCTTGKKPGKLGIFALIQKIPKTYTFKPFFFIVKEKRHHVWDILGDFGKKVVVANVPSVTEAWRVNGVLVAGDFMNLNHEKRSYPRELMSQIKKDVEFPKWKKLGEVKVSSTFKDALRRAVIKRSKIFQYLLTTKPWDFGFIVFTEPDRIQHKSWENKGYILEIHQQLDTEIAKILKIIDKDTIVLFVSDHGFGESKYDFNLNIWLQREGYLTLASKTKKNKKKKRNLFLEIIRILLYDYDLKRYVSPIVAKLPFGVQKSMVQKVVPHEIEASDVDWNKTLAYSKSGFGEIYLNVKDREPSGIIESGDEYERIREEIIKKLKDLKNPDNNKKLNPRIFKCEEIFGEDYLNQPPDLLINTDENITSVSARVGINKIFSKGPYSGNHRSNGFFLAYGPGIKKNIELDTEILNITPTILHIFDIPLPYDVDGCVISEIFDEESEYNRRKVKYQKSRDEKKLIQNSVKAMLSKKKI